MTFGSVAFAREIVRDRPGSLQSHFRAFLLVRDRLDSVPSVARLLPPCERFAQIERFRFLAFEQMHVHVEREARRVMPEHPR